MDNIIEITESGTVKVNLPKRVKPNRSSVKLFPQVDANNIIDAKIESKYGASFSYKKHNIKTIPEDLAEEREFISEKEKINFLNKTDFLISPSGSNSTSNNNLQELEQKYRLDLALMAVEELGIPTIEKTK